MRILIIGGTRFIGPRVASQLHDRGHQIAVFHRGQTADAGLPDAVKHIYGDRRDLRGFFSHFKNLAPEIVVDMICYNALEASDLVSTFRGVADRLVVASSMDVYRAYGCLLNLESCEPQSVALDENSPLRESRFPYRAQAKNSDDMTYEYDKIPVEQVVMNNKDLPATILRLPAVYGPGDHRLFDHLKRMDDGRRAILLDENHAQWRWTRGFVGNVAAAIALAAEDPNAAGRVYNVGEPDALTEAEWVRSIGRAAGWKGDIVEFPGESLPEHLVAPYDFAHHLNATTNRLRDELGYHEQVSREDAIKQTVDWERAHPPAFIDIQRFNYELEDAALETMGEWDAGNLC